VGKVLVPGLARVNLAEFGEFCRLKVGVNGPDVHMKAAGAVTEGLSDDERRWKLALYNCFSSVPTAAVIWARIPRERLVVADESAVMLWLEKHWRGIPVRNTRRPVRAPHRLAKCLQSVARFDADVRGMSYEEAWQAADEVWSWGRYVKIKYLETLRRFMGPEYAHLEAPNIRPNGGWSPRRMLSWLYPDVETLASTSNDRPTLDAVNFYAANARETASGFVGRDVSFYEVEALLCNYRQNLTGKLYPGRTIDSELEYHGRVRRYWSADSDDPLLDPYLGTADFFGARARTFPTETLGEVQGWEGPRPEIFRTITEFGYIWSDVLYDFNATTDFSMPVRR